MGFSLAGADIYKSGQPMANMMPIFLANMFGQSVGVYGKHLCLFNKVDL